MGKEGFVYCLSNKSYPGLLKIGVTRLHPIRRAKQLSAASGVPTPFKLVYFRDFNDSVLAEKLVHNELDHYRENNNREFFRIALDEAIRAIDKIADDKNVIFKDNIRDSKEHDRMSESIATPFAELFASFAPSDAPLLTEDEQKQCRALERRLKR